MKKISFTLLLAMLTAATMTGRTLQPIYFDDPTFDIHSASLSEAQRSFFAPYIQAMEQMEAGADAEQFFIVEHTNETKVVGPLLGNIAYDQGAPYNNKCPYINGGRAVTGCVATAMAQVMRYYKYPARGTGSCTYSGGSEGAKTINLDDYPFDWNNMLETYKPGEYTQEQADAVATLMLACGAALNMNYNKDASGSDTEKVRGVMKNNFGYSSKIEYINTKNSSDPEQDIEYWGEDAVRPEIDLGHPLIFGGHPSMGSSGHCFVVDGYKTVDGAYYYHVNWGWGGHGNSWCLLTRLEYDGDNYSGYMLGMVYYIYPSGQGLDEVDGETVHATKILRDGQLIIERNKQQYTVQGARIQ